MSADSAILWVEASLHNPTYDHSSRGWETAKPAHEAKKFRLAAEPKELPISRHRAKEMGSKRHLAEPGRRRLLLRLALGLAVIYAIRQHLSLRGVAHERLVALQAMSSTTTPLQTPSAERFFAPRAARPLKEPAPATRRLIVAETDTLVARSIPVTWPPSQVYDSVLWRRAPRLAQPPVGVGDRKDPRAAVRRLDVSQIAFRASRRRVRDAEFFGNDRTAAAFITKRLAELVDQGGARKS